MVLNSFPKPINPRFFKWAKCRRKLISSKPQNKSNDSSVPTTWRVELQRMQRTEGRTRETIDLRLWRKRRRMLTWGYHHNKIEGKRGVRTLEQQNHNKTEEEKGVRTLEQQRHNKIVGGCRIRTLEQYQPTKQRTDDTTRREETTKY